MTTLYAATAGLLSTNAGNWVGIPGLSFTLPAAAPGATNALVTLNVPNPYAKGNDFPGGYFGIAVNGAVLTNLACFTSNIQIPSPPNTGRSPTTLVVRIGLLNGNTQLVEAQWMSVRNSTVIMDTPSTLSAIIA
jgi:hypothetical protein